MNLSRVGTIVGILSFSAISAFACGEKEGISPVGGPDGGADATSEVSCSPAFPAGPYGLSVGDRLPDVSLRASDGAQASLATLRNCSLSRLLVLRVGAPWSGPYRFQRRKDVLAARASALRVVDVLLSDRDNHAATSEDAARLAREIAGAPVFADVPAGPNEPGALAGLEISPAQLPAYVFVDTWTMQILALEANPTPTRLLYRADYALARLSGQPAPAYPNEPLIDGIFDPYEWELLQETMLSADAQKPLPDPSNRWADDPAAAALGARLFADATLSPSGTVSCATCHDPATGYEDHRPRAVGVAEGVRKSPRIGQVGTARNFFWDGRAPTLAAQALGPFENPKEFGSDRCLVVKRISANYGNSWTDLFGALPTAASLPDRCAGGLDGATQAAVDRAFVHVGEAIAAYERTFRVAPNRVDRYLAGARDALNDSEKLGLHHFGHDGCLQCHWGPRFSDDAFHALRFPGLASPLDLGRGALPEAVARGGDAAKPGAFKTPPLRGVAKSRGFGHAGAIPDLLGVAHIYRIAGAGPEDATAVGTVERWLQKFHEEDEPALAAFLAALNGDAP
jgi:cytochrome c peroxidase